MLQRDKLPTMFLLIASCKKSPPCGGLDRTADSIAIKVHARKPDGHLQEAEAH